MPLFQKKFDQQGTAGDTINAHEQILVRSSADVTKMSRLLRIIPNMNRREPQVLESQITFNLN